MTLSGNVNYDRNSDAWKQSYLLLRCLAQCRPIEDQKLTSLCINHTSWDIFLQQLEWHRIWSIVWRKLKPLKELAPDYVYAKIAGQHKHTSLTTLKLMAALREVVSLFEQNNLRYLSLKGPVLSQQLYGDPCVRQSKDIDIIVEKRDIKRALTLLQSAGYTCKGNDQSDSELMCRIIDLTQKDITLFNKKLNVQLELHWRWDNNPAVVDLDFEQAWQRRIHVELGGCAVATLCDADNFIYLSIHGGKCNWIRLSWITDFDRWVSEKTMDWADFTAYAAQVNATRAVAYSMQLTNRLLATPVPLPIQSIARSDRTVMKLTNFAEAINCQAERPIEISRRMERFALRPGWRYRWYWYVCEAGVSMEDIRTLPLPVWLFPLYYLLRPALWLWRYKFTLRQVLK